MFGWIQSGLSNTAFSNVNSNDLIIRTQNITDKIVMGTGKDSNRNATLYITNGSVGLNQYPGSNTVFDVQGVFQVTKDSNVNILSSLTSSNATICNLAVDLLTYTNAQAQDLNTSNLAAMNTTTSTLSASNATVTSTLTVGSGIYPVSNNSATLGSSLNRFEDLWLGGQSLNIRDTTLLVDSTSNLTLTDNTNSTLRSLIAQAVEIGGFSGTSNLRLAQSNDGRFVVYSVGSDGSYTPMSIVSNIFTPGSNVGINVEQPTVTLDVGGDVRVQGDLYMRSNIALTDSTSNLVVNPGGQYATVSVLGSNMFVEKRLGITTSNPEYPLDVPGIARLNNLLLSGNQLPFLVYNDYVDADQNTPWYGMSVPSSTSNTTITGKQGIVFLTSNAAVVIDNRCSGLGIGTSNVNTMLQFSNDNNIRKIVLQESNNNQYQVMGMGTSSNTFVFAIPSSAERFSFFSGIDDSSALELFKITGQGKLKIGTGEPLHELDVTGTVQISSQLLLGDSVDTLTTGRIISAGNSLLEAGNDVSIGFGKDNTVRNQAEITYRHIGDNSESNLLVLGHSGVETMAVSASGYVGIGTNAPMSELDVRGKITAEQDSTFSSNVSVLGSLQTTSISSLNSSSNVISIGCDSNTATVNIGTGSNATTINIGGLGDTVNIQGNLTYIDTTNTSITDKTIMLNKGGDSGTGANSGLEIEENSNVAGYILVTSTNDGYVFKAPGASNTMTLSLLSNIGFNNAIYISSTTSNVGFGTALEPSYNIHLQNSNNPVVCLEALSNDTVSLMLQNSNAAWSITGPQYNSNDAMQFSYQQTGGASTPIVTLQGNSMMGIGTDAPQYELDVVGTINATGGVLVNGLPLTSSGGGSVGGGTAAGWQTQSSNIYTNCNIGVKTSTPRYALDVSGTVNASTFFQDGVPFTAGYWSVSDGFMYTLSNVGINNQNPAYALDVGGAINAADIYVNGSSIASGFWQLNGGNIYSLSNVGVGTAIPSKRLDVVGDGRVNGDFTVTGATATGTLLTSGEATLSGGINVSGMNRINSTAWGHGIVFNGGNNRFYADVTSGSVILNIDSRSNFKVSADQSDVMTVSGTNGYVGIGTDAPAYDLDVSGTINASNYVNVPWSGLVNVPDFKTVATSGSYADLLNKPGLCNVATTASYTDLRNAPTLCNVATTASFTDLRNVPAFCNVATTADYNDLINAPALSPLAISGNWSDISQVPSGLSGVASNDLSNFNQNVIFQQRVGIAKASPAYALDVVGAVNASSYCNVDFNNLVNKPQLADVATSGDFTDLNNIQPLSYFVNDISYFGCNVGVMVSSPLYPLHVNGAIYATTYCNLDWSMVKNAPEFARPSYSNLVDAPQSLTELNNDLYSFTCNIGFGGNSNPQFAIDVIGAVKATSYCNVSWTDLVNKPNLCNIATTASWADIANKPSLSELSNDLTYFGCNVGIKVQNPTFTLQVNGSIYATGYCNLSWSMIPDAPSFCNVALSGSYNDIVGKPTSLSQFTNDLSNFNSISASNFTINGVITATTYCNIDWSMIGNKPAVTVDYNLLSNKPVLCNVATSGAYADLTGVPNLCNVALSADYNSLDNLPELGTLAYAGSNSYLLLADTPALCNVSITAEYADLLNTPTNLSAFTNDLSNFNSLDIATSVRVNSDMVVQNNLTVSNLTTLSNTSVNGVFKARDITTVDTEDIMFIGCTSNVKTINIGNNSRTGHIINIGTTSAPGESNVINLGGITDTVYVPGGITYVYQSQIYTSNHVITLNTGGQLGSSAGAGILIEEDGGIKSYIKVSDDMNSLLMRTPNSTSDATFDVSADQLTLNGTLTTTALTSNVGIGTTQPGEKLHIQNGNVRIQNTTNTTGQKNAVNFSHVISNQSAKIESTLNGQSNIGLALHTYSNGQQLQVVSLSNNSVGIATSSPQATLHVNGDISMGQTLSYSKEMASAWSNGTVKILDVITPGQLDVYVPNTSFSNSVMTLTSAGAVGIGTTSPSQKLEVVGMIASAGMASTDGVYVFGAGTKTNNTPTYGIGYNSNTSNVQITSGGGMSIKAISSPILIDASSVGIGTTTPTEALHVIGSIRASSGITSQTMTTSNITACNISSLSNFALDVQAIAIAASNNTFCNVWNTTSGSVTYTTGSVGIGTSSPAYALDVTGGIRASNYYNLSWSMISGIPSFANVATSGSYTDLSSRPVLCNVATTASYTDLLNSPDLKTVATTGSYTDLTNKPTTLTSFTNNLTNFPSQITFCNNIGIKKDAPAYEIDVSGTVNASNFLVNGQPISTLVPPNGYWTQNAAFQICFSNVGCTTSNPMTSLAVGNDFSITASNAAWNTSVGKGLYMRYSTNGTDDAGYIQSITRSSGTHHNMIMSGSNITFVTNGSSNLYLRGNGMVGVGTASPVYTLDVAGAIRATTYCNVKYTELVGVSNFAPVAYTGVYSNLTGVSNFAAVAYTGSACNLTQLPVYATVASSGSYTDLTNRPTNLTAFTNDLTTFSNAVTFKFGVSMSNQNTNRGIVLYDSSPANSNQYTGFGVSNNGTLRYQVLSSSVDHIFFAGATSNSSTELMRITGAGRVGIGTATPSQSLHVFNGNFQLDGSTTPTVRLQSSTSSSASSGELQMLHTANSGWIVRNVSMSNALNIVQQTVGAEASRLWISTNVGINTTAPAYTLDVNGTINATTYCNIAWSNINGIPSFQPICFNATWSNLSGAPTRLSFFTNDLTNFSCNVQFAGTGVFTGNVGIGTATPTSTLDVNGTVRCSSVNITGGSLAIQNITSSGTINLGADTSTTVVNLGTGQNVTTVNIGTGSAITSTIIGNASDVIEMRGTSINLGASTVSMNGGLLTLNSSGILNSATNCGFQIFENSNATSYIKTSGDRSSFLMKTPAGNEMSLSLVNNAVNINNNSLYIGGDGRVGIGTNTPSQKLEVDGSIKCNAVITTSDATLKTNIARVHNSLDKLKEIDAVYFNWKETDKDASKHVGVLAQQVQKVLPEAVVEGTSGMGVDYNSLIAL
jgi:hypothetical protein